MANKKVPKNYDTTWNRRKQRIDEIEGLPAVTSADAGKIMKVGEDGKWHLGSDENTIIVANPDEQPTVDLENLKIGNTVYSVKIPELTSVKSFKLTMSNGGQYNTNKPIIEFFNEAGQEASITSSDYTVECDKTYQGNAGMDQVCSILTPDTPGTFTYTFVNDFDIENYSIIKLTRGGAFVNDIAKNIKIELSVDGENYITIYDETTITWSDAVPYHLISLKDGSEASTLLPIVTGADNGKFLGVVNGVWDKTDIPTDTTKKLLVYNCDTPTTLTRTDNNDGSYRYKFKGTVSTAIDENNNDIKTLNSVEVNPNTVIILNLPFGRFVFFALQKSSSFTIRFLGVASSSQQLFNVAFDDIYNGNEQLLVNGIAGVAKPTSVNYRPNNYELTFEFDVYTSDYPIHST